MMIGLNIVRSRLPKAACLLTHFVRLKSIFIALCMISYTFLIIDISLINISSKLSARQKEIATSSNQELQHMFLRTSKCATRWKNYNIYLSHWICCHHWKRCHYVFVPIHLLACSCIRSEKVGIELFFFVLEDVIVRFGMAYDKIKVLRSGKSNIPEEFK